MTERIRRIGVLVLGLAVAAAAHAGDDAAVRKARAAFVADHPQAGFYEHAGRVSRVYGQPLAIGNAPVESAESFRAQHAGLFDARRADLVMEALPGGDAPLQPIMFDPDLGDFKFYLARYAQQRDGVAVFRGELRLLIRNEPGFPVVLAASDLRDLGDFAVASGRTDAAPGEVGHAQAVAVAAQIGISDHAGVQIEIPGPINFGASEYVIWAGNGDQTAPPRLAVTFIADNGLEGTSEHGKWLFVADAASGEILHAESMIIFEDVVGNVSGMATRGPKADPCAAEIVTPMMYARVNIVGGGTVYADENGDFVIPNGGTSNVTVQSEMRGQYVRVNNVVGGEETLSMSVSPPGPADFLHNAANTEEFVLSQVNGYVQTNVVRDFCLTYSPAYPTIATQTSFPVNVNLTSGYCPGNAWYDYSSINFCQASGPYPNTSWSSVIHHEYGHHMVARGGGSDGAYHEGMADCVAMLIADDPILGYGFTGNCNTGLRSADNNFQYPCIGEAHYCGQLLSGCVWSTREELVLTEPDDYLDILSSLTVNSILLIGNGGITPAITIDFLTLDDDDDSIANGTPHYPEICAGFGAHAMDCPPISVGLIVTPGDAYEPGGQPGGPFAPESMEFTLHNLNDVPMPYEVTQTQPWLDLTNATGTIPVGQTAIVTATINAGADALGRGEYYDTLTFVNLDDHFGDTTRDVTLTVGLPTLQYVWDMNTDPGWSTTGLWAWGQPTGGGGQYGNPDPTSGFTGDNVYGYNLNGDYQDNLAEQYLTTTAIDCSNLTRVSVKFRRWLGVDLSFFDHASVRVSNDGANWTSLWHSTAQLAGGAWVAQEFDISSIANNQPTVYIRWTMGTTDATKHFCGWNVDDVELWGLAPEEVVLGDIDGDGDVDFDDLNLLLAAYGTSVGDGGYNIDADLDGDGEVDFDDLNRLLAEYQG